HRFMGRAEILANNLPEGLTLTQSEKLESFVVKSLAQVDRSFRPLMRLFRSQGMGKALTPDKLK
ncbi:MAG: hypothetical protein Q7S00_07540, partial [bacterium]|nr:hypothetical protein [bacterium]